MTLHVRFLLGLDISRVETDLIRDFFRAIAEIFGAIRADLNTASNLVAYPSEKFRDIPSLPLDKLHHVTYILVMGIVLSTYRTLEGSIMAHRYDIGDRVYIIERTLAEFVIERRGTIERPLPNDASAVVFDGNAIGATQNIQNNRLHHEGDHSHIGGYHHGG